jgi:hypothetical protein
MTFTTDSSSDAAPGGQPEGDAGKTLIVMGCPMINGPAAECSEIDRINDLNSGLRRQAKQMFKDACEIGWLPALVPPRPSSNPGGFPARGKAVAFRITPAISPIYKNNPAFSKLNYDIQTGDITDINTYYLDQANSVQTQQWANEYSFSKAYGYLAFNSENLLTLTERFRKDVALRDRYARYYSALAPLQITSENWFFYFCAQTTFTRQAFEKSMESLRKHDARAEK